MEVKLTDIASVIRSKNAGPYELTLDIIFNDREWYDKVRRAQVISRRLISELYRIPDHHILDIIEFEPAAAIKITVRRPMISGDIGDSDVYGAQQHAPLLGIKFKLPE
ncbi:MAG: DUF4387 domain-containing protein [Firmicutes bacterium HGW-Firmicutes-14]|nr:MAG: DUF4387 domain-containing protein [Firmicutes bacterium HGW-Firmicutes-14]